MQRTVECEYADFCVAKCEQHMVTAIARAISSHRYSEATAHIHTQTNTQTTHIA